MPILKNRTVILRFWRLKDVDRLVSLAKDPAIPRFTHVPRRYTRRHGHDFIKLFLKIPHKPQNVTWAIIAKDLKLPVGAVGLYRITYSDRRGTLGYWMGRPYRKQGYTKEACQLVIDWAFKKLKLRRIDIFCSTRNHPSCKLLESLGAIREGKIRQHSQTGDRRIHDVYYYGILKKDWM